MLLLLAFVCLAGALVLVGQLVTKPTRDPPGVPATRARSYYGGGSARRDPILDRLNDRYSGPLAHFARPARSSRRPRSESDSSSYPRALRGRSRRSASCASKVVLGAVGVALGVVLGALSGGTPQTLLLGALGGAIGFFGPDFVVDGGRGSVATR